MPGTAEPEARARRRRALLVATGTYDDPGLAKLRAPAGDVDALADVLQDGTIGEFEVTRLVDRATEDLKRGIEVFFAGARRDDLLLLYFSCHGVLSQSRNFYFATRTTALETLLSTAIEDSFVNRVMEHSRARSIVLILDCCHSGAFSRGVAPKSALTVDVEHRFEGHGRVTLSASTALEYAFEASDPATGMHELDAAVAGSLFTRCLVEGLSTGDADLDRDGAIAVDELYEYAYQRMRRDTTHQTPGMAGDVHGEIVIARSRRGAALPEALQEAIDSPLAGVREGAVGELAKLLVARDAARGEAARQALVKLAEEDDSRRVRERAAAVLSPEPAAEPAPAGAPPTNAPPPVVRAPAAASPANAPSRQKPPPEPPPAPAPATRRPPTNAPWKRRPRSPVVPGAPGEERRRPRWWLVAAGVAAVAAIGVAVLVLTGGGDSGAVAYDFSGDGAQEVVIGPVEADAATVVVHPGTPDGRPEAISAAAAGVPEVGPRGSFGDGITSADFDGDDHADLAIGTPALDVVVVLYGGADGIPSPDRQSIPRDPELVSSGEFGDNMLGRDLNRDGYADLVVSAPGNGDERGAVQIFFGSDSGLQTSGTTVIEPPGEIEVGFGRRLRSGDVDGDGDVDLVEGAPDGSDGGHLTFCPGGDGGPTACNPMPAFEGDIGTSALAVADLDNDGKADIVQADRTLTTQRVGGLRVWMGADGGPEQTPKLITAETLGLDEVAGEDAHFGTTVDAGPVDADEYADIVTGAPDAIDGAGAVAIIRGGPDGYAREGQGVVRSSEHDSGARFGSNLALLRLPGGDGKTLDLVVAAEGVEVERSVVVVDGDGRTRLLGGIDAVVRGSGDGLRIGRVAGR